MNILVEREGLGLEDGVVRVFGWMLKERALLLSVPNGI